MRQVITHKAPDWDALIKRAEAGESKGLQEHKGAAEAIRAVAGAAGGSAGQGKSGKIGSERVVRGDEDDDEGLTILTRRISAV